MVDLSFKSHTTVPCSCIVNYNPNRHLVSSAKLSGSLEQISCIAAIASKSFFKKKY